MSGERRRAIEARVAAAAARLEKEGRYTATRRCIQHGKVSVYAHCVSVADTACVLAETLHLRVNERALIRGALLHDYFLYDWHDKANGHHWHGFTHPGTALHNASEDWKLTPVEREIIKKHMFPLTPIPPTCREAWLVCLADKICAAKETTAESMASCRLPRSITRRISKLTFYMQKIQKPDAVLTSGFWHFTRRGEKLGIQNGMAGKSSWQGLNLL